MITGGNSGVGLAIAKTLGTRDADVVITGWDRQTLAAALGDLGTLARGVCGDVTKIQISSG